MNYIVYLTVNLINHKVYVGVHRTNPDIFDGYIGCGVTYKDKKKSVLKGFPKAIEKYGYENFSRRTLKIFPDTEEGRKQAYYMESMIVNEKWIKSRMTYNLCKGGEGGSSESFKKEIAQYTLEGKFIRTWSSIIEAENSLNLTSISAAVTGRSKYAGYFQWRYYIDESDIDPVIPKEKTVYQFDLSGNLLKVWKSCSEAGKIFSNPTSAKSSIMQVCSGKRVQAFGYFWSYKSKFELRENKTNRAVAKYDDSGKFIESFTTLKEAAESIGNKSVGNIISAIKGTQKHCGGFRWRYFYGNTSDIKPLK